MFTIRSWIFSYIKKTHLSYTETKQMGFLIYSSTPWVGMIIKLVLDILPSDFLLKCDEKGNGVRFMSIYLLIEAQVQLDKIEEMKSNLARVSHETRDYDGCQSVDVYFDLEEPGNMVAVQKWESRAHYEKFRKERTESGIIDRLGWMLAGQINVRYLERADI
jgi:quinol monooxygenase YgiN